jgi:hypothetical protein
MMVHSVEGIEGNAKYAICEHCVWLERQQAGRKESCVCVCVCVCVCSSGSEERRRAVCVCVCVVLAVREAGQQ